MTASMKELGRIKDRLLARRADLAHRRGRVEQDLERVHEPLAADFADQAVQRQNDAALQAIGEAADEEIAAIDLALQWLESGHYGVCIRCQQILEPERLLAVPHAVTCASCVRS